MIDASKLPRIPTQLQGADEMSNAPAGNRVHEVKDSREQFVEPVDMVLEGGRYYAKKIGRKAAQ